MRGLSVRLFVASVGLNAALAIGVLLAGDFDETGGRILFTSLSLTGAALIVLACEAGRDAGRLSAAPPVGTAAAVAGFGLLIAGIWAEWDAEWPWQLVGTLLTPAVAIALLSLTSRTRLPPRFRWTFAVSAALASLLAAMLVSAIWGGWENEWFSRLFGMVAVALAAFTIVIPVLGRSARRDSAATDGRVAFCPACGQALGPAAGDEANCPSCGAQFSVRFRTEAIPDRLVSMP